MFHYGHPFWVLGVSFTVYSLNNIPYRIKLHCRKYPVMNQVKQEERAIRI